MIVQTAGGIGIAEKHRIIEIEQQSSSRAAQQETLPAGQQAALQDHIGSAYLPKEAQPRPPAARQRPQFQRVPRLLQQRTKRRQTIAAADMFRMIDQADPVHGFLSPRHQVPGAGSAR